MPLPSLSLRPVARLVMLLCAALWLTGCSAPGDTVPRGAGGAELFAPDEVIALVRGDTAAAAVRLGAGAAGFAPLEEVRLAGLDLRMMRYRFAPPLDGAGAIDVLEAVDPTVVAGVNHAYRVAAEPDAGGRAYADLLMAWPAGGCRALGPIGLLDTGVDPALLAGPDGAIVARSFVRGRLAAPRHGTDVASVLLDARRVAGARIYSAAVVGGAGPAAGLAGVDSLIQGIDWLAAEGVRVVNVSLAGPYNKLLDLSVSEAVRGGMTLVAAMGNDGAGGPPRYPAAFDDVIAVTAVDAERRIYRRASRGAHVDVAAPGVDIAVADRGTNQTRLVTGTSMAAPFVTLRIATDAALLGQPATTVRRGLTGTTQDLGPAGTDATFGAGLVLAPRECRR